MKIIFDKNVDKTIIVAVFIFMKFLSYFLFSPFIFILGLDFIFLLTIFQNKGLLSMQSFFEQISHIPYVGKDIYLWAKSNSHMDGDDLKFFMGKILFFISIVYILVDMVIYALFKKKIKINTIKLVSIIMMLSYLFFVGILIYFSNTSGTGILIMIPFITIYMIWVYIGVILSIKFNDWSVLLLKNYLGK